MLKFVVFLFLGLPGLISCYNSSNPFYIVIHDKVVPLLPTVDHLIESNIRDPKADKITVSGVLMVVDDLLVDIIGQLKVWNAKTWPFFEMYKERRNLVTLKFIKMLLEENFRDYLNEYPGFNGEVDDKGKDARLSSIITDLAVKTLLKNPYLVKTLVTYNEDKFAVCLNGEALEMVNDEDKPSVKELHELLSNKDNFKDSKIITQVSVEDGNISDLFQKVDDKKLTEDENDDDDYEDYDFDHRGRNLSPEESEEITTTTTEPTTTTTTTEPTTTTTTTEPTTTTTTTEPTTTTTTTEPTTTTTEPTTTTTEPTTTTTTTEPTTTTTEPTTTTTEPTTTEPTTSTEPITTTTRKIKTTRKKRRPSKDSNLEFENQEESFWHWALNFFNPFQTVQRG